MRRRRWEDEELSLAAERPSCCRLARKKEKKIQLECDPPTDAQRPTHNSREDETLKQKTMSTKQRTGFSLIRLRARYSSNHFLSKIAINKHSD